MKKIIFTLIPLALVLILTGCASNSSSQNQDGQADLSPSSVYKSEDGGSSWLPQHDSLIDIEKESIFSLAINPLNGEQAFFGLAGDGILRTDNGGKNWEIIPSFKAEKVYGLALDFNDPQIIYASGVWQKRGKIYKSYDGGNNWDEIYTEAAEGPLITTLKLDEKKPSVVYAANSENGIIKSVDGGKAWKNIFKTSSPVTEIIISSNNSQLVYLLTSNGDIYRSLNGGGDFLEITDKIGKSLKNKRGNIYVGAVDSSGKIYLGGEIGIIRSANNGENWEDVITLSDSETFPVRALAINPNNDQQIIYGAARAVYTSEDGGATWSSFQLDSTNIARSLQFDLQNPAKIYFALIKQ